MSKATGSKVETVRSGEPASPIRAVAFALTLVLPLIDQPALAGAPIDLMGQPLPDSSHFMSMDACEAAPAGPERACLVSLDRAAGWLVAWHGEAVMIPPYYSRHSALTLLVGRVEPDLERVDEGMSRVDESVWESVAAILPGHDHVDHLGDLPLVAAHAPHAQIYGSASTRATLAPMPTIRDRVHVLSESDLETPDQRGTPISISPHFRVLAVRSDHAPHVDFLGHGISVFGGRQVEDRSRIPRSGWGWKLGDTRAWVIDLLDDAGRIAMRVYVNDAATTLPDSGALSASTLAEHPIDVALLTAAGWRDPQPLLKALSPRLTVLHHWADFMSRRAFVKPVPVVLSARRFEELTDQVDSTVATAGTPTIAPANAADLAGPHGKGWRVAVPGEALAFDVP